MLEANKSKDIGVEHEPDVVLVRLRGFVGAAQSVELANVMRPLSLQNKAVIVDFSTVGGVASKALRVLLDLCRAKYMNANVILCGANPQIHRQLAFTGLTELLEFHKSEAAARASLRMNSS